MTGGRLGRAKVVLSSIGRVESFREFLEKNDPLWEAGLVLPLLGIDDFLHLKVVVKHCLVNKGFGGRYGLPQMTSIDVDVVRIFEDRLANGCDISHDRGERDMQ